MISRSFVFAAFMGGFAALAHGQTPDTWVMTDGRMFEAQVKSVAPPGVITFTLRNGTDQPLGVEKLSDRSKKRLAELLGLAGVPIAPVAAVATTAPATSPGMAVPPPPPPPPAAAPAPGMAVVPRNSGATDATDMGALQAGLDKQLTVIGKVAKVDTLGRSGHKLVGFEGSEFSLFVNKRQLDQSADWNLEGLVGKTVQVTGKVTQYNGKLQIQAFEPAQVGVVE